MGIFPIRQAIERLRAGLFDPVAVDRLTMEEEAVVSNFSKGLEALRKGKATHLCICGSYGQGKSHTLNYLHRQALSQGYAAAIIQLDIREVPFHRFSVVYQSLMKNLCLPTRESFIEAWEKCSLEIGDDMPHRFRMILKAMRSEKKNLKFKDFDYWLKQALEGHNLPTSHLKQILKAKEVEGYLEKPLIFKGNGSYIQMVQSLGKLLHAMGYKGLVLFFDEAESIVQGRLRSRVKSYEILNEFFQHSGFVYPVVAFTETFFDQVRSEEYTGEAPQFPQNYFDAWENLQIIRLQESPSNRWETLQDRLIHLYAEAYQIDITDKIPNIKRQMKDLLEKLKMQETRFKLKALIHQLDIICARTAS